MLDGSRAAGRGGPGWEGRSGGLAAPASVPSARAAGRAVGRLAGRRLWIPIAVAAVFVSLRYWLATTSLLSETYYDEALTGLMSLAILRGVPQVFYWGQPYLGAEDAYLVAGAFRVFGVSTFVLRMTVATVAVLWGWAVYSLARRAAGNAVGLLAGLYMAVPPIFLSYVQLSSHGETISLTLGTLALAAGAALLDERVEPRGRGLAWVGLGLAGGLGWWASQMMGMFLLAAALVIVVARPRVLREPGPYVALGLFFLTSAPFWLWNARHEWATFWHLATWGDPLPPRFSTRLGNVVWPLLATFRNHFWDGRAVRMSATADRLWGVVLWTFYAPALALAAWQAGVWAGRLWRGRSPWRGPLDLVVVAFWGTVLAHLVTWFGTSGVLRYSMTFYATVPVLGAVALGRVAARGRAGRAAAVVAAAILLLYNGLTQTAFVRDAASAPTRPVDGAIHLLDSLGVRACYADSRIAQVIAFESAERIECADYDGLRNYEFLERVDAVEDPATVAIVTHRVLKSPGPRVMADMLRLIGGEPRVARSGDYVIYHHVRPPDSRVRPIGSAGWRATASSSTAEAPLAFDRRIWTWWSVPRREGEWFLLDLGGSHELAQVDLVTAPQTGDAPVGIRVETSRDGRVWERAAEVADLMPGVHWWRGHPRADESGRVVVRMTPRPARYVRVTELGQGPPGSDWSIGELFAYETAPEAWAPPPAAAAAVDETRRELAHWMDDPGGPNPRRAPVTMPHRRAQVRWHAVFAAANRALDAAPEWEEAHHVYGLALSMSGWTSDPDEMVARAVRDQAWREVLRWAEMADARRPEFWRSGRDAARAQALAALGREGGAGALGAPPAVPGPVGSPPGGAAARFGRELELTGVALPASVRPGDVARVQYRWRALSSMRHDYWAFVHILGPHRQINEDHVLGAITYGTGKWMVGEEARESLTFSVPPDTPPGTYRVKLGVWLPETGKRLRVTETTLPLSSTAVEIGTLTVVDPAQAEQHAPAPGSSG